MKKTKGRRRAWSLAHAWHSLVRTLRFFLVVLLGYLLQVSVMPYVKIGGITPNLCLVVIAVVTVCHGRWHALWAGEVYGILFETMLSTVKMLNLLFYPLAALLCSVFFADRSEKRLEELRTVNPHAKNGNVYLRTLGNALLLTALYELVHGTFNFLAGNGYTSLHFTRSAIHLAATAGLTALLMVPLRVLLGFRKQREPLRPSRYQDP